MNQPSHRLPSSRHRLNVAKISQFADAALSTNAAFFVLRELSRAVAGLDQ